MEYNIQKGHLNADVDCQYDKESNKIDMYGSSSWWADTEEEYKEKEELINNWNYEDDLIKAFAWCDISGYDYWIIQQEERNYLSIDVYLKKPVEDYTQEEIQYISELIREWDDYFLSQL